MVEPELGAVGSLNSGGIVAYSDFTPKQQSQLWSQRARRQR
jgi:hypothetical protein